MKNFEELKILAERKVQAILKSFPEELQKAAAIPVILEKVPVEEDQEEGIDADILGLFVGPTLAEIQGGTAGQAPHVILFLQNIWDEAEEDPEVFEEEVEITLLHELGHYLDWDEDDLEERGLG